NPAKDIITLNSESPIQSIKIVDLTGREVKSVSGTDNLTVKVDVRDLEPGNYLVVSTGEQRQHVHQLVIQ
ncbi:MAG: T9SS type A sorting domain-containing protein, partial [Bacteroidota bacterium]